MPKTRHEYLVEIKRLLDKYHDEYLMELVRTGKMRDMMFHALITKNDYDIARCLAKINSDAINYAENQLERELAKRKQGL